MYRSKARGRNRIELYNVGSECPSRPVEADRWAFRLTDALKRKRLTLLYQPVLGLSDGAVHHWRAVPYLPAENGELVPPSAFGPAAERFGLMPELTRQVVREVVKTLLEHPEERVFVSLSAQCLADDGLLQEIHEQVVASKIEPARLGFEIAEETVSRALTIAQS